MNINFQHNLQNFHLLHSTVLLVQKNEYNSMSHNTFSPGLYSD